MAKTVLAPCMLLLGHTEGSGGAQLGPKSCLQSLGAELQEVELGQANVAEELLAVPHQPCSASPHSHHLLLQSVRRCSDERQAKQAGNLLRMLLPWVLEVQHLSAQLCSICAVPAQPEQRLQAIAGCAGHDQRGSTTNASCHPGVPSIVCKTVNALEGIQHFSLRKQRLGKMVGDRNSSPCDSLTRVMPYHSRWGPLQGSHSPGRSGSHRRGVE